MTEKKIYRVPAIFPRGFLIEIVDYEQNPIKGVEFSYVVDWSSSKNGTTDDRGILNIRPLPQNEVKLSFGEQLESPPGLEEETTKEPEEVAETASSEVETTEKTEEIDETTSSEVFLIEIVDDEQNPVKGVEFSYIVDGIYSKNGTTDDQGILKVQPMPQNEVKIELSLVV